MKERPILFSAPMVRALLDGSKTQTRRLVKPLPPEEFTHALCDRFGLCGWHDGEGEQGEWWPDNDTMKCPYGKPGDQLYVKETCKAFEHPDNGQDGVIYSADGIFRLIENSEAAGEAWHKLFYIYGKRGSTCPSIFMPRWASRIQLEITGVRVERLQAISEADAEAEGVKAEFEKFETWWQGYDSRLTDRNGNTGHVMLPWACKEAPPWLLEPREFIHSSGYNISAKDGYKALWQSLNGDGSWAKNPWVWVIEFRRVAP